MFCLVAQQVSEHLERRHDFGEYIAKKRVLAAVMNSVAAEIIHYDEKARVSMWNDTYHENFSKAVGRPPRADTCARDGRRYVLRPCRAISLAQAHKSQ